MSEAGKDPPLRAAACRAHGCMIGIVDAASGRCLFYHQPPAGRPDRLVIAVADYPTGEMDAVRAWLERLHQRR